MWPPGSGSGLSQARRQACPGRFGPLCLRQAQPQRVTRLPGQGPAALVPSAGALGAQPEPPVCAEGTAAGGGGGGIQASAARARLCAGLLLLLP